MPTGGGATGLKPSLLTPEVLDAVRLRLAEPPPDGGLWSSRKVADVMAAHLGLERVLPQRGWEALQALGLVVAAAPAQEPEVRHGRRRSRPSKKAGRHRRRRGSLSPLTSPVEVFCTDEHRLGLKPILRSVWAPKGQRPIALGHHRFQWLYVTAFVGPTTGETV